MSVRRVLVVEDDQDFAEGLADVLELEGFEVVTAPTGEAGLERFGREPFDVAILDMKLPGMNGVEVLLAIKALAPRTEVVMVTGFTEPELIEQARRRGARDVVHKPFEIRRIVEILDRGSDSNDPVETGDETGDETGGTGEG